MWEITHGLSGGPFVRQAGWAGGWVEGLVYFRKNIYMYKTDIIFLEPHIVESGLLLPFVQCQLRL